MKYIFESAVSADDYHVGLVKETLNRRLTIVLPDVIDEVVAAVNDCIVTGENGIW